MFKLTFLLLISLGASLLPARQVTAPPPRPTDTFLKDDLIFAPARWYAGADYVIRFSKLYQVVPSGNGPLQASDVVSLRVSCDRLEKPTTFPWLSEVSKPFYGQFPGWNDYAISLGTLSPGHHELVVRCELLLIGDVKRTIAEREYRLPVDVVGSIDELDLEPFLSPTLARSLDARLEQGRLKLTVPDDFKANMPLTIQIRKGSQVLANGITYLWARDPGWVRVVGVDQGDPTKSPVDLNWKGGGPPDLTGAVIELQGSPEVALRAGIRRYWAGSVLIPVKQQPTQTP